MTRRDRLRRVIQDNPFAVLCVVLAAAALVAGAFVSVCG